MAHKIGLWLTKSVKSVGFRIWDNGGIVKKLNFVRLKIMNIRQAKIPDAQAIHALVSSYAELDKMLFLSMADIYENLQRFTVAEVDGQVLGCCALQVVWSDLAEIRSLAIDKTVLGKGIGKALVHAVLEQAEVLGTGQVFTLTLEAGFFEKQGFKEIPKEDLPMKVWSGCAKCSKQENCDETAMIYKAK
jgi:amino-acid N-acetyltransferase